METTAKQILSENKIIKVLAFIMKKLDTLEIEQERHKEMFYKVRKNLIDANDLINQILDVLEIENPELYSLAKEESKHVNEMVSTIDDYLSVADDLNHEQLVELMNQIPGEA